MEVDVALIPSEARSWPERVCIVIDELRASSTLTTLIDLGCTGLFVTRGLADARRLAKERHALLAGERGGITPDGFDYNNSPAELVAAPIAGRNVVLCTSNGTRVLGLVAHMPATLIGCLLNATACAEAAIELAAALGVPIGLVCAGRLGRFALDDAVAAGAIVERILHAAARAPNRSGQVSLTDAAVGAVRLRSAYPDLEVALAESSSGRLVTRLGAGADIAFCARIDVSRAVPILQPATPLEVVAFGAAGDGGRPRSAVQRRSGA